MAPLPRNKRVRLTKFLKSIGDQSSPAREQGSAVSEPRSIGECTFANTLVTCILFTVDGAWQISCELTQVQHGGCRHSCAVAENRSSARSVAAADGRLSGQQSTVAAAVGTATGLRRRVRELAAVVGRTRRRRRRPATDEECHEHAACAVVDQTEVQIACDCAGDGWRPQRQQWQAKVRRRRGW
jgi:hypothetical protein